MQARTPGRCPLLRCGPAGSGSLQSMKIHPGLMKTFTSISPDVLPAH